MKKSRQIKCDETYEKLEVYCKEYKITLTKIRQRLFLLDVEKWSNYNNVIESVDAYFTGEYHGQEK